MSDASKRFGELRGLLHQPPSQEVWAALCAQLTSWPAEALEAEALPYAAAVLDRWPTEPLRGLPDGWFNELVYGRAPRAASLITTFKIAGHIEPDFFWELLRRAPLERLRSLTLEPYPALEEAGWRELAALPLAALERLTLRRTELGDAGLERLTEARWFGGLRQLHIAENGLHDAGRWLAALRASSLEQLNLSHNPIEGGLGRVASERWERLEALTWYGSKMRAEDARRLTRWTLPALHTLRLGGTQQGDAVAETLASGPLMAGLAELSLVWSNVCAEGLRALAASPEASGLKSLSLMGNNMLGAMGVRALLSARWLSGLKRLELDMCGLDDEAGRLLLQAPQLEGLSHLTFSNNRFSPGVLESMRARWPEAM